MIDTFSSSRHLVESSIVHICYDDMVGFHFSHNTYVPIDRMCTWSCIHNDRTCCRSGSCWDSLRLRVSEPVFCISSPGNVFIFRHETSTVTKVEIPTTTRNFECERIIPIRIRFTEILCRSCVIVIPSAGIGISAHDRWIGSNHRFWFWFWKRFCSRKNDLLVRFEITLRLHIIERKYFRNSI